MFSDLRKAGGRRGQGEQGRDGELLPLKVGSSNMPVEDANLLENLDRNQGSKMI